MEITALDGRGIEVRRRWFPWRLRKRDIEINDVPLDFTDGIEGLVIGIVLAIVFLLFGSFIILGFEVFLLLFLIVPLFALGRMFWVLPWTVEARNAGTVLGVAKVRGWRASTEKIREIAAAYQRGEDPFHQPEAHPGQGYTVG